MRIIFILIILLATSSLAGQQIVIVPSDVRDEELETSNTISKRELDNLTANLEQIATKTITSRDFSLVNAKEFIKLLGEGDIKKYRQERQESMKLNENELIDLGKKVRADYVVQCKIYNSNRGGLRMIVELYATVGLGQRLGMLEIEGRNINDLISKLKKDAVDSIFKKIPGVVPEPQEEPIVVEKYITTYPEEEIEHYYYNTYSANENNSDFSNNHTEKKEPKLNSISFSLYNSSVTSVFEYKNQELKRNRINFIMGFDITSVPDFFIGGGTLGNDIREFILGGSVKWLFWPMEKRLAIPISLAFAWRVQWADIENNLVTQFIDEPAFLKEPTEYLNDSRSMTKFNFDIMPTIDLQIFINDNFSIYTGYMYCITIPSNWTIRYKIPGKSYKDEKGNEGMGDKYTIPDEFNPLKDSKEQIFGIPGTLRLGVNFYFN